MGIFRWCMLVAALLAVMVWMAAAGEGESRARLTSRWTVEAEYPQTGVQAIDKRIRTWLEEHINRTVADVVVVSVDPDFDGENWDMGVTYKMSRPFRRVVSIVFETYTNPSRAAHPMARVDVLNFDAESGRQLHFEDFFEDPGLALEIMSENAPRLANEEMKKKLAKEYPEGLAAGDWFMEGFNAHPTNYAAMIPEEGGARVIFQKYQVLPYVFGMPEVFFPLDMLEAAVPEPALWEK